MSKYKNYMYVRCHKTRNEEVKELLSNEYGITGLDLPNDEHSLVVIDPEKHTVEIISDDSITGQAILSSERFAPIYLEPIFKYNVDDRVLYGNKVGIITKQVNKNGQPFYEINTFDEAQESELSLWDGTWDGTLFIKTYDDICLRNIPVSGYYFDSPYHEIKHIKCYPQTVINKHIRGNIFEQENQLLSAMAMAEISQVILHYGNHVPVGQDAYPILLNENLELYIPEEPDKCSGGILRFQTREYALDFSVNNHNLCLKYYMIPGV